MPTPVRYAELEIACQGSGRRGYRVALRFVNPESDAETPPETGAAAFDLEELLALEADPGAYGAALAGQLFAAEAIRTLYAQARCANRDGRARSAAAAAVRSRSARAAGPALGAAGRSAQRRRGGRPRKNPFSRLHGRRDWRTVKIGPKAALRALVAVAAPSDLAARGLGRDRRRRAKSPAPGPASTASRRGARAAGTADPRGAGWPSCCARTSTSSTWSATAPSARERRRRCLPAGRRRQDAAMVAAAASWPC